jgi:phosphoribosylformimino-5-aminoimidazole carboxamide ribotide isomerase
MAILPVIDLKGGLVVRGVAGRREEYRPIVSRWTSSAGPLDVARALAGHFGFTEFYLADLDAIGGGRPAGAIYDALNREGYRLWVDAGIRTARDAVDVAALGAFRVVVGLETIEGPRALRTICAEIDPGRLVFSLDLHDGQPLGDLDRWDTRGAVQIARRATSEGISRLLVLDLSRVGVGAGVGTEVLCGQLRRQLPSLDLAAGGGVRGPDDVRRLYAHGVNHVLVASALHDGRIEPAQVP